GGDGDVPGGQTVECIGSMELKYAEQFSVDYYSDGSARITVGDEDSYLLLPEGAEAPEDETAVVLHKPLNNIYLASSSVMDLFGSLDALDRVRFCSTSEQNWQLPEVREAMQNRAIVYAGKYNAPDFEMLLSEDCPLAVENTMIYHSPDIKEQLESLGLPVIVERSSYESHPLGRVEWIKLYGLLLGCEDRAREFFDEQLNQLSSLNELSGGEKTVAFFHVNTVGAAVVRRPGDYVTKMIEMAGGKYVFSDIAGNKSGMSTMNMQMESFYSGAKDADVLIYNSTIDGKIDTLDQMLAKSELLADFKAVKEGNVWCTEQSMFQRSSASAGMISDINAILSGKADDMDSLTFLHRLK
ncbi:MAG: ABC transporter substrate-binding protein, partial [Oscillospiraceae bacterium]|nr:ABC transporter substrate-binding protein [Oscillospiraceae bacterium]